MGHLKPGDTIQFIAIDYAQAVALESAQTASLRDLRYIAPENNLPGSVSQEPVLKRLTYSQSDGLPEMCVRQAGDRYLLVEYGEQVLDLELRFRVHALMQQLQSQHLPGVLDLMSCIR